MLLSRAEAASASHMEPQNHKKTKILIPQTGANFSSAPYLELAEKYSLEIDFKSFLETEPIGVTSFRKHKAQITGCTSIIFTSKKSIDYFFTLADACSIKLSADKKYFCTSPLLTYYLQKYVTVRKRKTFDTTAGNRGLIELIKKHKKETFLLPGSNIGRPDIELFFQENPEIESIKILVYQTHIQNLQELPIESYDIIAFFIPYEVTAFLDQFPNFSPANTRFAAFGQNTRQALSNVGWESIVHAPTPRTTSLVGALKNYFKARATEQEEE